MEKHRLGKIKRARRVVREPLTQADHVRRILALIARRNPSVKNGLLPDDRIIEQFPEERQGYS